jgi:hypothetical protein
VVAHDTLCCDRFPSLCRKKRESKKSHKEKGKTCPTGERGTNPFRTGLGPPPCVPCRSPLPVFSFASKIKRQLQNRKRREGGSPGLLDARHAATLLVRHRANLLPGSFFFQPNPTLRTILPLYPSRSSVVALVLSNICVVFSTIIQLRIIV